MLPPWPISPGIALLSPLCRVLPSDLPQERALRCLSQHSGLLQGDSCCRNSHPPSRCRSSHILTNPLNMQPAPLPPSVQASNGLELLCPEAPPACHSQQRWMVWNGLVWGREGVVLRVCESCVCARAREGRKGAISGNEPLSPATICLARLEDA